MIQVGNATVYHGWGRDVLPTLPADSFDSVVCDPPYGLSKEPDMREVLTHWLAGDDYNATGGGFMGKTWDSFVPGPATWREIYRVLKPGGYALVFAGSRTVDLMGVAVRLAGFEVRDMVEWIYGSGFPKSLNVANAIHDAAIGQPQGGKKPDSANHGKFKGGCSEENAAGRGFGAGPGQFMAEAGGKSERELVPAAAAWQGWGTALKPAHEPILVLRKPLSESSVAANVLRWGTGGINIDGCRVDPGTPVSGGGCNFNAWRSGEGRTDRPEAHGNASSGHNLGRFPANIIHDGSPEVLACFPDAPGQQGVVTGNEQSTPATNTYGAYQRTASAPPRIESDTSAARFFYCAKASRTDRGTYNNHPTVKPQALMRYLVRLVTPSGGRVLDSFAGSGTTGVAAITEGFHPTLIEQDTDHFNLCLARCFEASY